MIERFETLLKQRIGLEAESVGRVVIERAVRQRIHACGSRDEDAYWTALNASPAEQQALVEAVVVPETWLFRYPESFAALGRLALDRLPALAPGRPLRILSLPCSTGKNRFPSSWRCSMPAWPRGCSKWMRWISASGCWNVRARVCMGATRSGAMTWVFATATSCLRARATP